MPRMRFELFVALRYLFSRRKQTFIYVISLMSILGVAIGVGALVVVLGVYNGLTTDMRDKILGANAHGIVLSYLPSALEQNEDVLQRVRSVQGVTGATPFIYTEVMLSGGGASRGWCCAALTRKLRRQCSPCCARCAWARPPVWRGRALPASSSATNWPKNCT